jgi:hypothetical protein
VLCPAQIVPTLDRRLSAYRRLFSAAKVEHWTWWNRIAAALDFWGSSFFRGCPRLGSCIAAGTMPYDAGGIPLECGLIFAASFATNSLAENNKQRLRRHLTPVLAGLRRNLRATVGALPTKKAASYDTLPETQAIVLRPKRLSAEIRPPELRWVEAS